MRRYITAQELKICEQHYRELGNKEAEQRYCSEEYELQEEMNRD